MQTYKSIAAVGLATALTVLVFGGAAAHGRQGAGPNDCPQGQTTCTTQPGRGAARGLQTGNWAANLPPAVEGELPAAMIEAMEDGIADEYHAAATYKAVIAQFGAVRPFTNILRAETQHAAAWAFLFDRYGLETPVAPAALEVPEFTDRSEACAAAAQAERDNMALYDQMLATVKAYPDITQVVTSLRDASMQNHLPAFARCAGTGN